LGERDRSTQAFQRQHYLVCVHFASYELQPPELQSLFQREADTFEEETVLHPTAVTEVVALFEGLVELPHAEWERLPRKLETVSG